MTTKEAAKKWKVSQSTVQSWCKGGLLESAEFDNAKKTWEIKEGTLAPYLFRGKQHETFPGRLALILKAMKYGWTIPPQKFDASSNELEEAFFTLLAARLIEERVIKSNDNEGITDLFRFFKPTISGMNHLDENKKIRQIASDLAPLVSAITEGAVKAQIAAYKAGRN